MDKIYKSFSIFFVLAFSTVLFSQIPNPGFEQWIPANPPLPSNPSLWFTSNFLGLGTTVTPVTASHSGEAALRGEVIVDTNGDTLPPLIISGQFGEGFPMSDRPGALTGYYKFSPVGDDELFIGLLMYNNNNPIGVGELFIPTATSNFTQFEVPIDYVTADIPDLCIINIYIDNQGNLPHPGSYYIVDDLAFSAATGINDEPITGMPAAFELKQNYPNPFNPVTHIRYAIPQAAQVKLEVYNSLGQKVTDLVNEQKAAGQHVAEFNASELPSGIYFYRITAGSYQKMMKMMLMK